MLPLAKVIGLDVRDETVEDSRIIEGLAMDIVSHDVRKFFGLLLKKNGYVLEQLFSPLIVHATPGHAELKAIAPRWITRHHSHHYFGFAETQWQLFLKESPRRVKPLLYVYRVLLTGIHLMRTGEVEANLVMLNEDFRLPDIADLVARKLAGPEKSKLFLSGGIPATNWSRDHARLRHSGRSAPLITLLSRAEKQLGKCG